MMFGRSDPPGQWSVYAEFTISHPGVGDPQNVPITRTEQNDNKVRMTYSWNSQRNSSNQSNTWDMPSNLVSDTTSNPSTFNVNRFSETTSNLNHPTAFGFQKGDLLFTSIPPCRREFSTVNSNKISTPESSGYSSNLLSPHSLPSSASLQRHEERKCRSTCNITLCPNQSTSETCHQHCGRTQSLRCQTPSSRSDFKNTYYGCGDPWCHHLRSTDSIGGRCSPVLETCEDSGSLSGRSNKATRSLSRELDNRKDVSVQTFEMVDKCTSPFLDVEDKPNTHKKNNKVRKIRRRSLTHHRGPEVIPQRSHSPSSFTPDSLESDRHQITRRITRSPKLKKMPDVKTDISEHATTTSTEDKSSGSKKPRTVHIDVYCTGTEAESDSLHSDLSGDDTASTPQTVFESEQVKITHKRADVNDLPINIQDIPETTSKSRIEKQQHSLDKSDSDVDDSASTAYPSKLSSYSTIKDFSSSISSVPRSWTNYSMSSCAVPDMDCDSLANTSWKDNTYSDLDSVLQSRSSIAGTESLLFVPRKLRDKSFSIDEAPELLNTGESKSPSDRSLQLSDSFEYANSEDKLRIKRMEAMWQKDAEPVAARLTESKVRKQEKKMDDYFRKKLKSFARKESKESDSDDSADSGKGWTFVADSQKRIPGVQKINPQLVQAEHETVEPGKTSEEKNMAKSSSKQHRDQSREHSTKKSNSMESSLNESSQSPSCRTPSTVALIQRLSLDPTLRAPFALAPGQYTEQRSIAKKFGTVISAFKKPGHHIGPVRNPECSCAHCTSYYETDKFRSRARSVGDPPCYNWKNVLNTL